MTSYTRHTCWVAPPYAVCNVTSDHSGEQKIYYTYHRDIGNLDNVHLAVSAAWMFSHTQKTDIDDPHLV